MKNLLITIFCGLLCTATNLNAQTVTITFDWNYTDASTNITRATDAYGNLTGEPLPIPARSDYIFNGWFTTAAQTGGSRVLSGATGTKFTQNTTIYARWTPATVLNMNDIPPAFKENFDWLRNQRHDNGIPGYNNGNPERVFFNANGAIRQRNSLFHMIWEGNGTINWVVRWESDRVVTLTERRNMAQMLHESINIWARPLQGMPGWPFGEIEVVVVGWAVRNADVIQDRHPNEQIWVNANNSTPLGEASELIASAPNTMSRFANFGGSGNVNRVYNYPEGLHNRFDLYQWCTKGFGGTAGGDWGVRASDIHVIGYGTGVNAQGANNLSGVQTHGVGHAFGLYDLYGGDATLNLRRPPNTTVPDNAGNNLFGQGQLRTVMDIAYNGPLNIYDQWQIRYYWDWVRSGTQTSVTSNSFFQTHSVTVNSTGTGASGNGNYASGITVPISAGTRNGYTFSGWTTGNEEITIVHTNSANTIFTMPANAVTVTANWTCDHSLNTTSAATCTSDQVCSVCDEVLAEKLGHTPGATATCTTDQICIRCDYVFEENLGHDLGEWQVTTPPTETSEGEETRYCTRENCEHFETQPIPATGTTNIVGILEANIKVYPNPFNDILNITNAEGYTLRIMTPSGVVVHTQKIIGSVETLKLQQTSTGIYILHLTKEEQTQTAKIIKQ